MTSLLLLLLLLVIYYSHASHNLQDRDQAWHTRCSPVRAWLGTPCACVAWHTRAGAYVASWGPRCKPVKGLPRMVTSQAPSGSHLISKITAYYSQISQIITGIISQIISSLTLYSSLELTLTTRPPQPLPYIPAPITHIQLLPTAHPHHLPRMGSAISDTHHAHIPPSCQRSGSGGGWHVCCVPAACE